MHTATTTRLVPLAAPGRCCHREPWPNYLGAKAGNVVAHFDEWTLGAGLLTVKGSRTRKAMTVFTAAAAFCAVASICGNGKTPRLSQGYNGDQMAAELNMQSKHSLEKAAAHAAVALPP